MTSLACKERSDRKARPLVALRSQKDDKFVITVKEARKILGAQASTLSDTQVQDIIGTLTLLAKQYIGQTGSKNKQGV